MISDEVRELISAYVDGELPHADAARIEESAKRDPKLQRAIRAYRRLGETLRDWDSEWGLERDSEFGGTTPSPRLKETALARVRAFESEREHEANAPATNWWMRPAAIAAGLLIAVGLGLLASTFGGGAEPVTLAALERSSDVSGAVGVSDSVEPFADLRADFGPEFGSERELVMAKVDDWTWAEGAFEDVVREDTVGFPLTIRTGPMGDEIIYVRSWRVRETMVYLQNLERGAGLNGSRRVKETRTGTRPNVMLTSMLKGYQASRTEFEGLVVFHGPSAGDGAAGDGAAAGGASGEVLPVSQPAPARLDKNASRVQVGILEDELHYLRVRDSQPVLTLAGELWVEPVGSASGDRYGRARIVTGTTWVRTSGLVKMAWANNAAASANAKTFALRAESFVLGPKARRELLLRGGGRNGHDADLLAWITSEYGKDGLVAASRLAMRNSRARVQRMVTALSADEKATGFAVFRDNGKLLGTEIFGSHALLVQFAPRLLRGYMLESGGRIKLARANGRSAAQIANVREFVGERVPRLAQKVVDVRTSSDDEDWPKGMRQVNLLSPTREVIGHGLLIGNRPIHLTLFGD